ncbi:hypothetical protein RI129_006225 [Pyrocoelia pectoralis]|uniref:O-acyltransferase WSD1 C-terminal domain-containing protein n=1 Tax=Pyrocoelia pectoralis TaxID=417401 RepID=A0AAN7VAU6_9COLE
MEGEWCTETLVVPLTILLAMLLLNIQQLKEETRSWWVAAKFSLLFPVIICLVVVTLILQPFFFLYRTILSIKLRWKYGKRFYGLLSGADVPVTHPSIKYGMIGILMVVEIDINTVKNTVFECVQEFVIENILKNSSLAKLQTTVKSYGGYPYLESIGMRGEDCVYMLPTVDGVLDDTVLMKLLGRVQYKPFNGPYLWDVMVGTQPLYRKETDTYSNTKRYPVMIRVHHAIADGVTIMQLLGGVFSDKQTVNDDKSDKPTKVKDYILLRLFQLLGKIACLLIYFPSILYSLALIKSDVNDLHRGQFGNDENVALLFDENGTYLRKVKNIKNRTGASIPEIVCTAFSESLKDHIEKYKKESTKQTTFLLPVVRNEETRNMQNLSIKDISLKNKFSVMTLTIPFSSENEKGYNGKVPLYNKLIDVRRRTNTLRRSMEFYVSKVAFHIIAPSFPGTSRFYFVNFINNTATVSLLPGLPKGSYCNGKVVVTDVIFWIPHLMHIDLGFSSFSYDNRLILSFNCDRLYMSFEMAQEILDNVYKNIDLLEKELEFLHKHD